MGHNPDHCSIACLNPDHFQPLVAAYASGPLSPEQEREAVRHLRRCESCRREYAEAWKFFYLCRLAYAEEPTPEQVRRVKEGVYARIRRATRVRQAIRIGLAAAALLLCVGLVWLINAPDISSDRSSPQLASHSHPVETLSDTGSQPEGAAAPVGETAEAPTLPEEVVLEVAPTAPEDESINIVVVEEAQPAQEPAPAPEPTEPTLKDKLLAMQPGRMFYSARDICQKTLEAIKAGEPTDISLDELVQVFEKVIASKVSSYCIGEAHYYRFKCLEQSGLQEEPEQAFDDYLAHLKKAYGDKDVRAAILREGARNCYQGESLAGLRYYERLLVDYPESREAAIAYVAVGKYYYGAREYAKALGIFQQFMENCSGWDFSGEVAQSLALCHFALGKPQEGIAALKAYLKEHPDSKYAPKVQLDVAYFTYERLGQSHMLAALRELRKVFEKYSKDEQVVAMARDLKKRIKDTAMAAVEIP